MSIPGKGTLADNASVELFNYDNNTPILAKVILFKGNCPFFLLL